MSTQTCEACRSLNGQAASTPPHARLRLIGRECTDTALRLAYCCVRCDAELSCRDGEASPLGWRLRYEASAARLDPRARHAATAFA